MPRRQKLALRQVIIERAPPRRLAPGARWRSFKRGPDHLVWETATEELRGLLAEGYRVERVTVDWGKKRPMIPADVMEPWLREMCGATESAKVEQQWSGQGNGRTLVQVIT